MSELQERDAMICRGCGNEERASEGYPCSDCGTFICMMCVWRGTQRCASCTAALSTADISTFSSTAPVANTIPLASTEPEVAPVPKPLGLIPTGIDWPEH